MKTLPFLLALASLPVFGWTPEVTLCPFRSQEDLAAWTLRRSTPPSRFELGRDAVGEPAAVLHFPAYTGEGEKWPAITIPAARLPEADWSSYRYLRFFLTTPLSDKLPLRIFLRNQAGVEGKVDPRLPVGETAGWILVDLDQALRDRQEMRDLHFFMSTPPLDCPFTLRDLTLVGDDCEILATRLLAELAQTAATLADMGEPAAATLAQARSHEAELNARLAALRANPGDATGHPLLAAMSAVRDWLAAPERKTLLARAPYLKVAARLGDNASFGYGIASSMTKVLWQDVPFDGELFGQADIALAGDEEESVQIAAITLRDVTGLRAALAWADPACPLAAELGWMGHVKTEKPPYAVSYQGWWPDPILDFLETVDVPAERTQALWITVRAPRGAAAGTYRATVTLSCDDGTSHSVPLAVRVQPFDLPLKRHLPLALSWGEMLHQVYGLPGGKRAAYQQAIADGTSLDEIADPEVRRLLDIRRRTAEFLLRKRAEPDMIYRGTPPNLDEVEHWIALGMTRFNVLHVTKDKARNQRLLEAVMPEIERRGLLPYAYVYGYDEVKPELFPEMREVFADIKARWPGLPIMTTAYDHSFGLDTGLKDVVDIWVPLTPKYMENFDRIPLARAEGMQIWWYTCVGPRHPYANWFIEYPAIEARLLMGEQAFFAGTDGYLYYQLSRWVHREYSEPITKPIDSGPLTDWDPRSYKDNHGDGSVFCPGPDGPLSTIRLENIRDGLEDYEYLWMLRRARELVAAGKAASPSPGWDTAVAQALQPPQPIAQFMNQFDREPKLLLARRETVARLISDWTQANQLRTPPEP